MRVMGVDPGTRRVGLALSDEDGVLASPLTVIDVKGEAATVARVAAEAERHEVKTLIVGLPLRLDGSEGEAAARARRFGARLGEHGLAIVYWDERLSTAAAERAMLSAGMRRGERKKRVDKVAAAILLQSYLDAERARGRELGTDG